MNVLESYTIDSPYGKSDECAKLNIYDTAEWFVLTDITTVDLRYTFSAWIKSDAIGSLTIGDDYITTTTEWVKYTAEFTADSTDLKLIFSTPGTYYIYNAKLELGNKATDWSPSPEDTDERFNTNEEAISENKDAVDSATNRVSTVEASLQILADSVVTRVTDEDGNTSTLEQKGTGWVFSLSDLESTVSEALDTIANLSEEQESVLSAIDVLRGDVDEHSELMDYIIIGEHNGQPCIELGEVDGDFKLRITNTEMYFMAGSMILTTVTNQKMVAEKMEVKQELQQGGYVWMLHGNGNLGLLWKGGTT